MAQLFPLDHCQLESLKLTDTTMVVTLVRIVTTVCCPSCQHASSRIHSRYIRTIADLPWGTYQVCFRLQVRRFFCSNGACSQRIFAEHCGPMLPRSARRTTRLTDQMRLLAFATTAQGAAQLAHQMAIPISPRTILRIQHATPDPPLSAPEQVGIDDWAWKKGRTYGSLCVDLARRVPIDLLPDRETSSIAQWFHTQPSVQVVARDRGTTYIEGITQGAPQATQVADRWHLVKNLGEALEAVLGQYPSALQQAIPEPCDPPAAPSPAARRLPRPPKSRPSTRARAIHRHYQRQVTRRYHDIHGLRANGIPIARIARQVGVSRMTVYRYLHMTAPPPPIQISPRQPSVIESYKPYLIQRWNEGCRNASHMWRELRDQGHTTSLRTIVRYVETLRRDSGTLRKFRAMPAAPLYTLEPSKARPLSARQASYVCLRPSDKRTSWQSAYYARLWGADPALDDALALCQRFLTIVRTRTGHELATWIADAQRNPHASLKGFAGGLQKDSAAVTAGLTLPWSNGQTEAHVQRLKLLKRQMYGQASFALLRTRVLYQQPPIPTRPKGTRRTPESINTHA